jgi:Protein of unknown function DUF115/Methyltransferase domain
MLNVCCIQSGNYLGRGAEYVNILFDSVRRNLPEGYQGRFICFTDDPAGLHVGIETKPLPAPLPGWWSKVALFRDGLFPEGERVVFLDLDTLITGRLDDIFSYDGDFAILTDFLRPYGWQSSVMAWRVGAPKLADVWPAYERAGYPTNERDNDQGWLETHVSDADSWQQLFPDQLVSIKQIRGIPEKATVVIFHGPPRPHEVTTGWVPEVWKIGGMSRAELKAICNVSHDKVMENVRSACARKLPWFDFDRTPNDRHAVIVGGGPSLVDTIDDIKKRYAHGQEVWALNNSAAFLIEHGIIPDAHFIVDARPENAEFVRNSHATTTYYIASQCHPAVFGALAHRNVVLWHAQTEGVDEALKDVTDKPVHLIGGGSTVALHAMSMAFLMGYKKIHCYGMDSSYRDTHHAYPQALNDSDIVLDVLYGDHKFKCSSWMTGQANEFMDWYRLLSELDCTITVHGDGLLPTMHRDEVYNGHLTCAKIRASDVLARIDHAIDPVGVEVGVFAGEMSRALLQRDDLYLYMVDAWEGDGASYHEDEKDWHAKLSAAAQEQYMLDATLRTNFASDRRKIIKARSVNAAKTFDNGTLDFVFIDADHTYTGCKADIDAWLPKLKHGGLLCGHDYGNTEMPFPGVDQAVNELATETGLTVEFGQNFTWFVRVDSSVIAARYAA